MRVKVTAGLLLACLVASLCALPPAASANNKGTLMVKVTLLDAEGNVVTSLYSGVIVCVKQETHKVCDDQPSTDGLGFVHLSLRADRYIITARSSGYIPSASHGSYPIKVTVKANEIAPSYPRLRRKREQHGAVPRPRPQTVEVVLALYSPRQQDPKPGATPSASPTPTPAPEVCPSVVKGKTVLPGVVEGETVLLAGKATDAQGSSLSGAEVFVSTFEGEEVPVTVPPGAGEPAGAAWAESKNIKTPADGSFTFRLNATAESGSYTVSVMKEGFRPQVMSFCDAVATFRRDGPPPAATDDLPAAPLALSDELRAREEPLIDVVTATRRSSFTPDVMQALPIKGTRSFDEFALLAPGVAPPPETFGGVGPGVSAGVGTAGQFSVNGLRGRENNFTADGSDNNDEEIGTRRQGFVITVPQPIESVQELQVVTALGDTRFGRNIGGQVNVLTKTGGVGRFHGSLYAYVTDNRLNARDPFDQTSAAAPPGFAPRRASDGAPVLLDGAPLVRQSQVGGEDQFTRVQLGLAIGGQLTKDADTTYFLSAERLDLRASREAHFAVPSVRQRGAFDSGDTGLLLLNKDNRETPLFPASVPGDALFSLFPFPNNPAGPYGENTYSTVLPADGRGRRYSLKGAREFRHAKLSENPTQGSKWWKSFFLPRKRHVDYISGRLNYTDELSTLPVTGGALFSSLRPGVRTYNIAAFINRTLSPSTSDTIRLSVGGTRLAFGERRDATMLASSALPDEPFLLNAPLLLNVTRPNADGTLNAPEFVSAPAAVAARLNALGYQGVTQTEQITGPLGEVFVAGFSPLGVDAENFPQRRSNKTIQIADTLTSFVSEHVFTFGADVRKTRIDSSLDRNFRPRAVFHGLTSAPLSDALERPGGGQVQAGALSGVTLAAMGVPTGLFQTLSTLPGSDLKIHLTQANLFFQDQVRVHPTFHLTAGVRYELNTVPDTSGRRLEAAYDPAELRALAGQAAGFCLPPERCRDLVTAMTSAAPADFKVSFGADRNNFGGHLGFAWAPGMLPNFSLRGGGAVYNGQFPAVVIDQARNAFPDFLPLNLANFSTRTGNRTYLFNLANPEVQRILSPDPGLPFGIRPGTLNELASSNPLAFLVNQDLGALSLSRTVSGLDLVLPQRELQAPYAYHYGVTAEYQFARDYLVSIAYVGTRGEQLLRASTPDMGLNHSRFASGISAGALHPAQTFPYFSGRILPPQRNLISESFVIARTLFESSARSRYNSLQAEFRKRYRHALLIGSAFTYSHALDDASDFFDNAGAFALPQNSLRRDERASSNYDVRLRSTAHFVLDLQEEWFWMFGKWGEKALGGLQLAGVVTAQTGQPYTVNSAFDVNRDGNLTDRPDTDAGIERVHNGGRVQLRLAPGLNPRDLLVPPDRCDPPSDCDGAVGRNTFRTPGLYSIDFAVTHRLPTFGDGKRFVVRAEFFNLFNWANYGVPVRILESPGFGRSISTRTPPRTIQFVGKFQF